MDMTFHKIYTSCLAVYTAKRQRSSSGRLIPFQKTLPNKKHGILSDTVFLRTLLLALYQLF